MAPHVSLEAQPSAMAGEHKRVLCPLGGDYFVWRSLPNALHIIDRRIAALRRTSVADGGAAAAAAAAAADGSGASAGATAAAGAGASGAVDASAVSIDDSRKTSSIKAKAKAAAPQTASGPKPAEASTPSPASALAAASAPPAAAATAAAPTVPETDTDAERVQELREPLSIEDERDLRVQRGGAKVVAPADACRRCGRCALYTSCVRTPCSAFLSPFVVAFAAAALLHTRKAARCPAAPGAKSPGTAAGSAKLKTGAATSRCATQRCVWGFHSGPKSLAQPKTSGKTRTNCLQRWTRCRRRKMRTTPLRPPARLPRSAVLLTKPLLVQRLKLHRRKAWLCVES